MSPASPHKRVLSPPLASHCAQQRPCKRAKTSHRHPRVFPFHSSSGADSRTSTSAAARLLPATDHPLRPLTNCATIGLAQHDPLLPRHLPQSVLSCYPSPHHTLVQHRHDYISSSHYPLQSASNPRPSLCSPGKSPPMNYCFGPASFDPYAVSNDENGPFETSPCGAGTTDFLSGHFDGSGFMDEFLSSCPFTDVVHPLSLSPAGSSNLDMNSSEHSPSSSRSISRSSFGSSSLAGSFSPYSEDYPTPATDSAVTTPSPSESGVGLCSDFPQFFSEDFSFGFAGNSKSEHELPYVPGSALYSPDTSFMFDFKCAPQAHSTSATGSHTQARRHSEPGNVAALHFDPFFASSGEVAPPIAPNPADFMTLPIIDNLASTSAPASHTALPSSIAPHQTELPRALELKHPRPVRAFKPPILLSSHQYDPKDFVRRYSEPVLPLPTLDVSSHMPLESDEDEDMVECGEDGFEDEGYEEDSLDPSSMEGLDFEALLGDDAIDPNWSWMQGAAPEGPLPVGEMFGEGFDWTLRGAWDPATVPDLGSGTITWDAGSASY